MKSFPVLLAVLALALPSARAELPFAVELPGGFAGPRSAKQGAMQSFTYLRSYDDLKPKALFQVTIISLPPQEAGASLDVSLDSMLDGIAHRRTQFKKGAHVRGTLGSAPSVSADWEGVFHGWAVKGRMICAFAGGNLFCVSFQDMALVWPTSLPDLEKALQSFTFAEGTITLPTAHP